MLTDDRKGTRMDLSKILAISGHSGLFQLVGQMKNGIVVESLRDGKRIPAYASHKISALADISIYTYEEDVPLADVMEKIDTHTGGAKVELKGLNLRSWFGEVLEGFDEERVYTSDIKKIAKWYNEMHTAGLLDFSDDADASDSEEAPAAIEDAEIVEETVEAPVEASVDTDAPDAADTEAATKDVE